MFGTDGKSLAQLVRELRRATQRPLIVKLTPNVADIGAFAEICEENGADGLSTINTFPGMVVDVEACRPVIGNVTGGISGPAIRPMGVYATWKAASRVEIPVIGIGGIGSAADALQYMLAGAARGLSDYCERHDVPRIRDLVGALTLERLD